MQIKSISRTVSFGNYENISMSAEIESGETVSEAIEKLEAVIQTEVDKKHNYKTIRESVSDLMYSKTKLESELETMRCQIDKIKSWAEKYEVNLPCLSELPF